jgi:hypothetical protein
MDSEVQNQPKPTLAAKFGTPFRGRCRCRNSPHHSSLLAGQRIPGWDWRPVLGPLGRVGNFGGRLVWEELVMDELDSDPAVSSWVVLWMLTEVGV